MVFGHFNNSLGILPTPEQILHGLVLAQIDQFDQFTIKNFKPIIKLHVEMWQKIFDMVEDVEMRKPLTPKILSDPNHKFVKTLIYIYSMQTFIFSEMNRASRCKDVSKIKFYGPLAAALSFIIHNGNVKPTKEMLSVFRGLQIPEKELKEKYTIGNSFNL